MLWALLQCLYLEVGDLVGDDALVEDGSGELEVKICTLSSLVLRSVFSALQCLNLELGDPGGDDGDGGCLVEGVSLSVESDL